jgi:ATP-dependent HslUV protease, peptidase subunit HslV
MSIAVAVSKGGLTVIAADSQENFGDRKLLRQNHRASKITRVGPAYVATTGWGLYENILDHYLAKAPTPRLTNQRAIFGFFLKLWKELGKRYSLVNDQPHQDDDSPFADIDSSFLIANAGGIYHVSGNLTVSEFHQYYAVGSGASYALGVLHALYDQRLGAEEMARRACEAAMAFDIYCGGEIDVYRIPHKRRG